jgi:hypothetical protein
MACGWQGGESAGYTYSNIVRLIYHSTGSNWGGGGGREPFGRLAQLGGLEVNVGGQLLSRVHPTGGLKVRSRASVLLVQQRFLLRSTLTNVDVFISSSVYSWRFPEGESACMNRIC